MSAGAEAHHSDPPVVRDVASHAAKRARSWDVDVSLEELVSWDVLEQFMQDIPGDSAPVEHSPLDGMDAPDLTTDAAQLSQNLSGKGTSPSELLCGAGITSYPGVWPPPQPCASSCMPVLGGSASGGAGGGASSSGGMNAATLAQSLCSCWQHSASPAVSMPTNTLAPMWGAEFLPSVLGGPDEDRIGECPPVPPELDSPSAREREGAGTEGRQVHKQRFVWTADLHRRFEAAVNSLGIDHAKPQAISQLMNCEGEGAPTRQNIKSHLQKYRLLMQKRARQGSVTTVPGSSGVTGAAAASGATAAAESGGGGGGGGAGDAAPDALTATSGAAAGSAANVPARNKVAPAAASGSSGSAGKATSAPADAAAQPLATAANLSAINSLMLEPDSNDLELNLEQHLERQEMNLKVQMELQTKLHRQLLVQRQLQHQLEHSFNSGDVEARSESQRWQSTAALKNSLRERLTKHVVMQQEMLQHLDALVSSEVSKPAQNAEQPRATTMIRAGTDGSAAPDPVGSTPSRDSAEGTSSEQPPAHGPGACSLESASVKREASVG